MKDPETTTPANSDTGATAIGVDLVQQGKADALAKDLEYLAGATLAGIVVGTKVPIMLPSRSDPPIARLAAAALAVIMHYQGGKAS